MAQDIIVFILVYLCVFQTPHTSAVLLGNGMNRKGINFSSECQNCGSKLEKKIRREIGEILTKDIKPKYVKNISENFYKYPRKLNLMNLTLLEGWGAKGMPFNVLYTPNMYQQKIMKYVPKKHDERKPRKKQGMNMPLAYNLVLDEKKPMGTKNTLKKHLVPRKYYSLIPQMFVSYGWL